MKNKENYMKDYQTPNIVLRFFDADCDVITASDSNDNNYSDIEDWGDF